MALAVTPFQLLNEGADKIAINTEAVRDPDIIKKSSTIFGSQCIVVAIDVKKVSDGSYHVFVKGGREDTGLDALQWAKEVYKRGAGEILLTSMVADGTKAGFELNITKQISQAVNVPVIASGGAGTMEHIRDAFTIGESDAALAASIFHFKEIDIMDLKRYLQQNNIPVRL